MVEVRNFAILSGVDEVIYLLFQPEYAHASAASFHPYPMFWVFTQPPTPTNLLTICQEKYYFPFHFHQVVASLIMKGLWRGMSRLR
ncbi:hypothetical protein L0337_18760 [candidate division KSB1 bacterium]|nr:hypothetical protein [candidate division KSB1 bacterium]